MVYMQFFGAWYLLPFYIICMMSSQPPWRHSVPHNSLSSIPRAPYQPYNTRECHAVTQHPTLVLGSQSRLVLLPYNSLTHCSPYGWQAQAIWLAEERQSWGRGGGNRKVDVPNESRLVTFYLSEFWGYLGVKWDTFLVDMFGTYLRNILRRKQELG